ncbi:hypothetical protein ACJIZ3_006321 [Penstemon smallii]|uniref:Uncharacterized protein n=1 Tax=Penstemon smallii TaxID=265156 RepID=A0ABD3S7C6_9LAMI
MRTVILKVTASVLQLDSIPDPLTHELLLGYVDSVQKYLTEITPSIHPEDIQFQILQDELKFLERLVISYPSKDDGEWEKLLDVRVNVEAVARNIGSFVYQVVEKGNMIKSVEFGLGPELTDLVEKVKFIRRQVMDTILLIDFNRFGWKFPQTDRLGNMKYLINNLKEYLMDCKSHDLIMDWKDQVQIILDDLIMFESFLKKIGDDNVILDSELEDLSIRINNSSYEADYIIKSLYARVCPISYISVLISDFLERMKLIKTDVLEIIEKKSISVASKDRNHVVSQSVLPTIDVVIGFEDEMKLLKESLVSDRKELDVVSITGMPGLGKTTLAKKVYEDPLIASHFQLRAWCCVSQEYNKKDMLLDILSSVLELNDLIRRKSAEDLSVILHKQLTGRRYLIVVDDIWKIEVWDDLRTSFPNNNIGSRIMLTSRAKVIGKQAKYHTNPLELRFLTDDESWDLLKATFFRSKPCPLEFLHVGKKIAGKCKGLPLGVVVVAGLLLKSADEELGFWKQVEEKLSSHIASDSQGHLMQVLELSYKFLPNYLRPLFLYLGAFPEDKEISADNLIWLWIAEGFIQKNDLMTLEAQARTHLMDLIDRSLIMVAERSYNGNVKTCRVHDLLHEFCLGTAEKDSFLQQIHVYDESVPDPIISQWRLSMCLKRTDLDAPSPSITPPQHSFLFFNMNKKIPLWKDVVKSVLRMSKLLRVLHLESTSIDEESNSDLMMMVHLRYVSVQASWKSIPSSIFSIWKLETLIIKGVRGELTVPTVIWTMVKLRHLHINDRARFEYDDDDASKLENLETLSTPAIYRGHEKKLIRRLPNLRKLRCIFFDPRGDLNNNFQFPNLEPFDHLESLKLSYNDIERSSSSFILPALSLKKLTLSKFRLQWDAISTIVKKLPNLEVLKLGFGSVVGEVWNMGDVEFPNLKFLKLQSLNIKTWSASPENFPSLEKLVLERCKELKEIPDSLGDFCSLEKIELLWCNSSAAKSAKQIQDDQEDAGNPLLKVHVYPPDLDL